MKNLKYNLYFKVATIIVITLLLLIPTAMITGLINERERTQEDAIFEVSSKWANAQTITGPFLSIPYYKFVKDNSNSKDTSTKIIRVKDYIHVLPEALNVDGEIIPEKRNRGIYEIVVYNSNITISGSFILPNFKSLDIAPQNILFDQSDLNVGISDLRGLEKLVTVDWNDVNYDFNSGLAQTDVVQRGIFASIPIQSSDSTQYNFKINLELKGSQKIYFSPIGKTTDIKLSSTWNSPSYNGSFLPDDKDDLNGFNAHWNILHLNRDFPQAWTGNDYSVSNSDFGVDLILPVDNYQKTYRSIKYAILFIAFTFIIFFFIEVMKKVFIHPIQYILVGFALVIFYTLLLSIGEYLSFNIAFLISAIATIMLITAYVNTILKSLQLAMLISGILTILYGFIFIIIQVQDYALLIGSIGVFLILALVMYFSRKIDWYNLNLKE